MVSALKYFMTLMMQLGGAFDFLITCVLEGMRLWGEVGWGVKMLNQNPGL